MFLKIIIYENVIFVVKLAICAFVILLGKPIYLQIVAIAGEIINDDDLKKAYK